MIEEIVGVDGQLVDDLLDHWSHLHEGVDTTTNLLVDQVLQESHQLGHRYPTGGTLVEEGGQEAVLVEGDGLAEARHDVGEVTRRDEPSLVDVDYLKDLPHLQLLLLDGVSHVVQDLQDALAVRCALLGLAQASVHLGFQEALAAQLARDIGQGVHELHLADRVRTLVVHVVEELHEVLACDIEL